MTASYYSLDVEQSVLESLLINNDQIDNAVDISVDDFHLPQHQIVFNAIRTAIDQGKVADIVTISESLTEAQLKQCGGLAYLAELSKNTPNALNFRHYFDILRNYTKARQIKAIMDNTVSDLTKAVFTNPQSSDELIAKIEANLFKLGNAYQQKNTLSVTALLDKVMDFLEREDSPFIPTGFTDLDNKIGGLEPKEITVVGASLDGETAWLISLVCCWNVHTF